MDTKTRIYYDFLIPPTYIRLISERLALDHIVYTDATTDPIGYPEVCKLADTGLFDKILVCARGSGVSYHSLYVRYSCENDISSDNIGYVDDVWLDISEHIFVDSRQDPDRQ